MTSGSSGGSLPGPGYYPDPSIPGYIRYWNGSSWVPGTSRPAPQPGEDLAPPSGAAVAAAGPALAPPPAPPVPEAPEAAATPRTPALEESGPMFLDEDPRAPRAERGPETVTGPQAQQDRPQQAQQPRPAEQPRQEFRAEPAPERAWAADPARQDPSPRVSWGTPERAGQPAAPAQAAAPAPARTAAPAPSPAPAQTPAPSPAPAPARAVTAPAAAATASAPTESAVPGQPSAPVPWAQQVHDLARQVPSQGGEGAAPPPWRPVADDPFASAQEQARPASPGKRLAARLIDTVVMGAVVAAAAVPLGTAAYEHLRDKVDAARLTGEEVRVWLLDGTTGVQLGIVAAVVLVTGLLYEVLPTAKWGRTLGKKLLRLRVLDIESQYEPGFGQALRRWLTHTVLDALVIGVLGLVWCLFDRPWRQCWHDKAARTFVARER
ncbi:RDD family protein [Actinacidiphila glaucinigra]|uniref:RDD family protein n=1 Tax=Actinacidiphila glaucinigra TaxID=235986 RepID=UPI0037956B48